MSTDKKPPATAPSSSPTIKHREKGIRIFMWPKMIYIFPSAIVALDLRDRDVVAQGQDL